MSDDISDGRSDVEFEQQLRQLQPAKLSIDEHAIWFQAGRQSALRDAAAPKLTFRLGQLAWCSTASALAGALLVACIGSIWSQSNARPVVSLARGDLPLVPRLSPSDSELPSKEVPSLATSRSRALTEQFVDPTSQATNRLINALIDNNDFQVRTIQDWQDVMNGRRTIASLVMTTGVPTSRLDIDQVNSTSTIGSLYQEYFSSAQ